MRSGLTRPSTSISQTRAVGPDITEFGAIFQKSEEEIASQPTLFTDRRLIGLAVGGGGR